MNKTTPDICLALLNLQISKLCVLLFGVSLALWKDGHLVHQDHSAYLFLPTKSKPVF